jgi:Na+-driven multidrug efflux pump
LPLHYKGLREAGCHADAERFNSTDSRDRTVHAPIFGISGGAGLWHWSDVHPLLGFWIWQVPTHGSKHARISGKMLLIQLPCWGRCYCANHASIAALAFGGSSADVIYSAAQRTAALVSLVLIAANIIIAPKFAELYQQKDVEALGKVARHGASLMTAMASPALLLFLIAPQWVMGLFGADFSTGWLLLVIMALGQLVNVATGSVGFLLVMTGQERIVFTVSLIATAINLVLCVLLIPKYGALGASIAMSVSLASINLLRVKYVWQTMGVMTLPFVRLKNIQT